MGVHSEFTPGHSMAYANTIAQFRSSRRTGYASSIMPISAVGEELHAQEVGPHTIRRTLHRGEAGLSLIGGMLAELALEYIGV